MEYDFKSLSDYDFELLCCDLFSAVFGRRVENFRRGRDGGVDLRYVSDAAGTVVIQCKHYANTPFSGLKREMRREREKLEALQPQRYILAASRFLSPADKEELFQILQPFCRAREDVLGGNEINTLLRQHPAIERAHYKLWLTSTAVMEKILHSEIYRQSEFLQNEIAEKLKLYVQSQKAYEKARTVLNDCNCCIISGIPGIGKTTLAEILLIYYLNQGYQIHKVRKEIDEAFKVYRPEEKQAFLYDDFLGSTGLELRMGKNEGSEILSFMQRVSKQKNKKFILTTREYILNQARQSCEEFSRHDFNYQKCVISLEDYTKSDRARILYNHLYFYQTPNDCIADLLTDGRVMNLIEHPNYSPRLIEAVASVLRPSQAERFYESFLDLLDHPNKLWENAFCRQISPAARDLVLLRCTYNQVMVSLSSLENGYESYHGYKAKRENRPFSGLDFRDALKETEGTFLKIDRGFVSYHNPSVQDFVKHYIAENDYEFRMLCEGAVSFGQCHALFSLLGNRATGLCVKYREAFVGAALRTLSGEAERMRRDRRLSAYGDSIVLLAELNRKLQFSEFQALITGFIRQIPVILDEEQPLLGWARNDPRDDPEELEEIVSGLAGSGFDVCADDAAAESILQYCIAWFLEEISYTADMFLSFAGLAQWIPFDPREPRFAPVYEALEDYCDNIAVDEIYDLNDEDDCYGFMDKVESLEQFFHEDLWEVHYRIDDRLFEIREEVEDDADYGDLHETAEFSGFTEDRQILDMFESLLSREPQDDASGEESR